MLHTRPRVRKLPVTLRGMTLEAMRQAHERLKIAVSELYATRAQLIRAARAEGHDWAEIASALDMTTHGAIKASKMTARMPADRP